MVVPTLGTEEKFHGQASLWQIVTLSRQKVKSECPLRPSEIENKWHMMKNQNSLYFAHR